jgi:hypothetical protein
LHAPQAIQAAGAYRLSRYELEGVRNLETFLGVAANEIAKLIPYPSFASNDEISFVL